MNMRWKKMIDYLILYGFWFGVFCWVVAFLLSSDIFLRTGAITFFICLLLMVLDSEGIL